MAGQSGKWGNPVFGASDCGDLPSVHPAAGKTTDGPSAGRVAEVVHTLKAGTRQLGETLEKVGEYQQRGNATGAGAVAVADSPLSRRKAATEEGRKMLNGVQTACDEAVNALGQTPQATPTTPGFGSSSSSSSGE